jgi:isocitrate/isopropylmalate dehydrogenase
VHRIAIIPGDGVGSEVVSQARKVLDVSRGTQTKLIWRRYATVPRGTTHCIGCRVISAMRS